MGEQVLGEGDAARAESIFAPDPRHGPRQSRGARRPGPRDDRRRQGRTRRGRCSIRSAGRSGEACRNRRARAALEVAAAPAADVSAEEARLAANPDDHEARFAIAQAALAAGDRDAAADALLEIIARDRTGTRGRRARASCRCWRPPGSRTHGRGRSGGACRRCCSHDGRQARRGFRCSRWPERSSSRARNCRCIFSSRATATMVRDALAGPGRIGMIQPVPGEGDADPPPVPRPAASARSSASRSSTTAGSTSCCTAPAASG